MYFNANNLQLMWQYKESANKRLLNQLGILKKDNE